MSLQYFKRFRMEFDLGHAFPAADLPRGFAWGAWNPAEVDRHAWVKFLSFRDEVDADVFPCLSDYTGCFRLMSDISEQTQFAAAATWLIAHEHDGTSLDCGTIQGMAVTDALGAIQNVGVAPEFRRRGIGRALVLKSLAGFRSLGLKRVYLEVTAANYPAVELYRNIGFHITRTMYRSAEFETV
jgi:ribosomal protein S18 acetylase RimI-like enzyme